MNVTITKAGNGYFKILYADDFEKLDALRVGEEVNAKITKKRNLRHHRKFFALLNIVAENMPEHLEKRYPTVETIRRELKMELGYYDEYVSTNGLVYYIPKSMDFVSMDDLQFREFYNKAVNAVVRVFLPGADPDGIIEHIFTNF